jgi:serine/threonine-protein kinase
MGNVTRGQRVGRYELVHVLGEGGMGTVWLGHPHDAPDQLCAVKTVSPQYATDSRVCTMFIKEASLAAAIDHPNVVRLYDVGIHDDVPFFVMEWIDGFSLREVARTVADTGRRVPPSIALRIAADLCAGLHAAHELCGEDGQPLGLVHRDVSPHNVLVTREGVAKLIDFGVAKARDAASGNDQSVCGGLKGKVRYMAPEQALEKGIDRRADLFSVGAVTYQLLTGRAPFEGPNELAIINSLLSTNPVFVPEDLPEPVQWILRRALTRRPENRFADAQEMQEAIELALVELGEPDKHSDVAACLVWFDPQDEEEVPTAISSARELRAAARVALESESDIGGTTVKKVPSNPPPALAFAKPTTAAQIPARRSELDDESAVLSSRKKGYPSNAGSMRFVLLAAAFVGGLGILAALLVKDAPAQSSKSRATETLDTNDPSLLNSNLYAPSPSSPLTPSVPTNTPIIDMGDLEEGKSSGAAKPRVRRPPSAAAPPARPPAAPAAPTSTGKNNDLAGPLKVWK